MQILLQLMRKLVYPAAALVVLWTAYLVMARPYISDASGKIVVIYDADSDVADDQIPQDPENDSLQALSGFCAASGKPCKADLLNLHSEIHDEGSGKDSRIYEKLSARLAGRPMQGVISFLSSPDSLPIVRFCRAVQVPLLLVIAANDDLTAEGEDTRGIVFRMMPTNHVQAVNIGNWIKATASVGFRVALFHEPNSFGEFLHRELTHELEGETDQKRVILYNFEVTDQLQFADLIPQLWCQNIDAVVYLGFKPRALDLLNKLRSYSPGSACQSDKAAHSFKKLKVLLSSGAYQSDLSDREKYQFPFTVFAMLPTHPTELEKKRNLRTQITPAAQETEAFEYGSDSYHLFQQLADHHFQTPSSPMEKTKTGHAFTFDDKGQLTPQDRNQYHALYVTGPESELR